MSKRRKKVVNNNTKETAGDSRFSVLTDESDTFNPFKGLKADDVVKKNTTSGSKNKQKNNAYKKSQNVKPKKIVETFDEDVSFGDIFASWENGRSLENVKKKNKSNNSNSKKKEEEDFASVFAQWERSQGIAPKIKKTPPKKSKEYKPKEDFGRLLDEFEGKTRNSKKTSKPNINQILKRTDNVVEEENKRVKATKKQKQQKQQKQQQTSTNNTKLPENYKIIAASGSKKQKENNYKNRNNKFENKNLKKGNKIKNIKEESLSVIKSNNNEATGKIIPQNNSSIKAKAFEAKALEAKALEAKALEAKAIEAKAIEAKAIEAKAIEAKAIEAKAIEAKAIEAKAIEAKAIEAKAIEAKAIEAKAIEAKAIESKAIESKAIESKAIESKAIESKAIESKAIEAKAIEAKVIEAKSIEAKSIEDKAIEANDNEAKANEDKKSKSGVAWNVDTKISSKYSSNDDDDEKRLEEAKKADVKIAKSAAKSKNNKYKGKEQKNKRAPFVINTPPSEETQSKWNFSEIYQAWSNSTEEDKAIAAAKKLKAKKESKGISISYLRSMCPEAELDLHGLPSDVAFIRTREFLERSRANGIKKVSVITGKGLHSEDGKGVLRDTALSAIRLSGIVREAYHPKACDGGSGAIWVIFKSTTDKKVYF